MNTGTAISIIIALAILLLFSAYFSAAETAFTGFSQARMKRLAQKKKGAKLVLKLSENYNKILSTLLIGKITRVYPFILEIYSISRELCTARTSMKCC